MAFEAGGATAARGARGRREPGLSRGRGDAVPVPTIVYAVLAMTMTMNAFYFLFGVAPLTGTVAEPDAASANNPIEYCRKLSI